MSNRNRVYSSAAGLLFSALLVGPGAAQAQTAPGWLAFSGCWQPVGPATEGQPPLLCVVPTGNGVEMQSFEDGALAHTQTLIADGRERTVSEEGCESADRLMVGADGRWITSTSDFTCEGGSSGAIQGLFAMVTPTEWIHVQVVQDGADRMTGVMRYELADDEAADAVGHGELNADRQRALRLSRVSASQPLSVEDVIEASATVDPDALSAWIVESGAGFDIDADGLLQLADAGVQESVIDMVVATSYPALFAVQTGGRGDLTAEQVAADRDRRGDDRFGYRRGFGSWYSPFGSWGYSPYAYGYDGYGYGYGGYGSYGSYGYWGYRPTVVVVQPGASSNGGRGRAIRGRGYSRGGGSDGGGGSVSRPSSGSSGSASSGSSGSTSRSTGRKAKPRGG